MRWRRPSASAWATTSEAQSELKADALVSEVAIAPTPVRHAGGVRILGIHTTSREVYLAAIEDDETVGGLTERLQPPAALEAGEALIEFVDSVRRVLREIKPDAIHLLLPETWNATYRQHLDRAMLDTLIRLAAGQEAIPVEVLPRPTVRARLGLPKTGALESHLASAGQPIGRYWTTGRGLAALAAKATGSG